MQSSVYIKEGLERLFTVRSGDHNTKPINQLEPFITLLIYEKHFKQNI